MQEWQQDRDDLNDQHRHMSHLFAVYPGRQISKIKTPELADAAILSLRSRSGNYGINENTPFTVESSQAGEIQLLPAIPAEWAVKGSFTGLRARGGFTVECSWLNGKVVSYKISSDKPVKVKVRVNGNIVDAVSNSF